MFFRARDGLRRHICREHKKQSLNFRTREGLRQHKRSCQGEGSIANKLLVASFNKWQLQEDKRGAAKQDEQEGEGNTKKDDDISVLLEDSDDEWIPGMLKN